MLKEGGQLAVLKSARATYDQFASPDLKISQDEFSDKVVDLVNQELKLGWPREFKRHLMETLWPTLLRCVPFLLILPPVILGYRERPCLRQIALLCGLFSSSQSLSSSESFP